MLNSNKVIFFAFLAFNLSCYSFENEHIKMHGPKDWNENPKMFGSDVIFMTPVNSSRAPESLYVKTFKKSLGQLDLHEFIIKDLKKEFVNKNLKIISKKVFKKSKVLISYVEASFMEDGNLQNMIVSIAKEKSKYHYFMFQAREKHYRQHIEEIKNSISRTTFK